jgi:hypothetical protein
LTGWCIPTANDPSALSLYKGNTNPAWKFPKHNLAAENVRFAKRFISGDLAPLLVMNKAKGDCSPRLSKFFRRESPSEGSTVPWQIPNAAQPPRSRPAFYSTLVGMTCIPLLWPPTQTWLK